VNKFIHICILLVSISTILSCRNSAQQKKISWNEGDAEENKQIISSIKTQEKPTEIIYDGRRIQFFDQTFNGQKIQNTFVKKNYDQNKNLKSAAAHYFESKDLKAKNIQIIPTDVNKVDISLKSYLNENSSVKKYKNLMTENIFQVNQRQLKPFLSATYVLNDGTVWQAILDSEYKIISNLRQGSRFTDSLVHIYRFGPAQSSLTEALLKGLEPTSPLLSHNIFVDNESNKKIIQILPEMKFDPKDDRFDQLQAYYYLDYIQTWMQKNLNVKFPEKLTAVVNVGFPEKTNTAFYFQNKIRLGHGDDVTYSLIASDPSIVFHESFHALIDGLSRLPFDNEGGSINEGFADFFTCVALNRPYLAESSYLKAPYKRSLLDIIHLNDKSGGLYHDSLIISGLLWSINQKLGQDKTLKFATEILSKLTPISQFNDFNTAAIQVIHSDLSAEDQQTVSAILKTRGFNYE
jgi:Zn-dependent metalloprotease